MSFILPIFQPLLRILRSKCGWSSIHCLLGLLLWMLSQQALARPGLGPPSIKLRTQLSNVVVARLVEITPDHKLRFEKIRDLHNQAPSAFVVTSDARTARMVRVDRTFIVAYIAWETSRRPTRVYRRAGGPVLINITGAQPALFAYSKPLEKMLTWDLDESVTSPSKMLPTLLQGMLSVDRQQQDFFVTELATRKSLHDSMRKQDFELLLQILENPLSLARTRQFLLTHAGTLNDRLDLRRMHRWLTDTLRHYPTQLDLNSHNPGFIRAALFKLKSLGESKDADLLPRWLLSNSTGVVEAALGAMQALRPGSELDAIEQALSQSMLDYDTRTTLNHYQRRMGVAATPQHQELPD